MFGLHAIPDCKPAAIAGGDCLRVVLKEDILILLPPLAPLNLYIYRNLGAWDIGFFAGGTVRVIFIHILYTVYNIL